jgi:hypothetical protein
LKNLHTKVITPKAIASENKAAISANWQNKNVAWDVGHSNLGCMRSFERLLKSPTKYPIAASFIKLASQQAPAQTQHQQQQ